MSELRTAIVEDHGATPAQLPEPTVEVVDIVVGVVVGVVVGLVVGVVVGEDVGGAEAEGLDKVVVAGDGIHQRGRERVLDGEWGTLREAVLKAEDTREIW